MKFRSSFFSSFLSFFQCLCCASFKAFKRPRFRIDSLSVGYVSKKHNKMLLSKDAEVEKIAASSTSEGDDASPHHRPSSSIDLDRDLDLLLDLNKSNNNNDKTTTSAVTPAPPPPHPDRPRFHVMPPSSWINDPNGLCLHAGRHHAFFQHLEEEGAADWGWAMAWGHASSADLALWRRELVALRPTTTTTKEEEEEEEEKVGVEAERTEAAERTTAERAAAATASPSFEAEEKTSPTTTSTASLAAAGSDAAGCWSGCLVAPSPRHARRGMRPTLMYTGVVLREDHRHYRGEEREGEEEEENGASAFSSLPPTAAPRHHPHRHRHHSHHHPLRPHAPPPPLPRLADLSLEMIERQLVAVLSDERDERLSTFEKRGVFISHAPFLEPAPLPSEALSAPTSSSPRRFFYRYDSGFRDPFVYQRHDASRGILWRVLIGSGKRLVAVAEEEEKEKEKKRSEGGGGESGESSESGSSSSDSSAEQPSQRPTGTLLAYSCSTPDLALGPWRFEGEAVRGHPGRCVEERETEEEKAEEEGKNPSLTPPTTKTTTRTKKIEFDVGRMWECPFLIEVPVVIDSDNDDEDVDEDDDGEEEEEEEKASDSAAGSPGSLAAAAALADTAAGKIKLKTTSSSSSSSSSSSLPASLHLLCVSPYPHGPEITATQPANPPLYWLGELDRQNGTFDLGRAVALGGPPRRLDLGDALYAPTATSARDHAFDDDDDEEGASFSSSSCSVDAAAAADGSSLSAAAAAAPDAAGLGSSSSSFSSSAAAAAAAAGASSSSPPPASPLPLPPAPSLPPLAPPIMMAWAQELRGSSPKSGFGYSGALTLPRELSVVVVDEKKKEKEKTPENNNDNDLEFRLRQRPPRSVSKLREGFDPTAAASSAAAASSYESITAVAGGPAVEIPGGARGPFVDLELKLLRPPSPPLPSSSSSSSPSSSSLSSSPPLPAAVVLLRPWLHAGTETDLEPCAAAVVADWESGELAVVWPRRLVEVVPGSASASGSGLAKDEKKKNSSSSSPPPSFPLQIDWKAGVARRTGGPCAGLRKGGRNRSLTLRVVS